MISETKFIYHFLVRGIVYWVQEISFVRVSFKQQQQQQQQQQFIQVFPYLYMALPKLVIQMYKITSFSTIYLGNNLLYLNFIISKMKAATDLQMQNFVFFFNSIDILLKRNKIFELTSKSLKELYFY